MAITRRENKGSIVWSVDVYYKGRRYRKTVGSKKEAERVEVQIKTDIAAGKWSIRKPEEITFRDLVARYFEYTEVNKARSTYKNDRYRIEANLVPWFGNLCIRDICHEDIEEYKAMRLKQRVTMNTVNHEMVNLSHIFKMAIQWGYLDRNIMGSVERFRLAKNTPRFLSESEVQKLLDAAWGSYLYPVFVVALHTGMRKSELFNLQWSDIDFQQGTITIQSKDDWHTKNYKARTMDMTPVLMELLLNIPHESEYALARSGNKLKDIDWLVRSTMKRAGLAGVTLHTLRHTFASQLVLAGVTLREVQELMGHQSYETTLKYAHLSQEHVKKQVLRLPYGEKKDPERKLRIIK